MSDETRICEQCETPMPPETLTGSAKHRKRCVACCAKVPSDYWSWAKNGRTLAEARELAARYTPGRKTPAKRKAAAKLDIRRGAPSAVAPPPPLSITEDGWMQPPPFPSGRIDLGHSTQEEVEADLRKAMKTFEEFTDDGPAHPLMTPKGLLGCLYALEETQARVGALLLELRRVVLGEDVAPSLVGGIQVDGSSGVSGSGESA